MRSLRHRAITLVSVLGLLTLTLGVGLASADDHRNADNSFTKWVDGYPNMSGIVGGDVGDGTFNGTVVNRVPTATDVTIDAIYRFSGSKHSFVASVHVYQTGTTFGATSVITGRVTDGWLRGNRVEGHYAVIQCTAAPSGMCFAGELDILRGTKSGD